MPHERHDPLLKNEPARNSYGATSSSSGLEVGAGNAQPEGETTGWFPFSRKQVIAGSALLLSGGMKVAELIVTKSYRIHGPFEPVRGMVMIGWILTYMLQLDYIHMIGHTPTDEDEDPTGYAAARTLALSETHKFVFVHVLLALWQLFHIIELPILSLVSICLAFLLLINMYWRLHGVRPDKDREAGPNSNMTTSSERHRILSPSFVQGPISSLLVMTATIWVPRAVLNVVLFFHPPEDVLRTILWPLAIWLFFITFIGSHISTRIGYIANKHHATSSAAAAATAGASGSAAPVSVAVGTDKRLVPIDLAGVLGLFWASIAIAAGPGVINDGPVVVVGYLAAGWQALSIVAAIV